MPYNPVVPTNIKLERYGVVTRRDGLETKAFPLRIIGPSTHPKVCVRCGRESPHKYICIGCVAETQPVLD